MFFCVTRGKQIPATYICLLLLCWRCDKLIWCKWYLFNIGFIQAMKFTILGGGKVQIKNKNKNSTE
jgi:hypothetical protein